MIIDENRIRNNLEIFTFPRLSGTIHEKKAFSLAKKKIEEMGLIPEIQTFKFSTFYSRIYPKIAFPLTFWILLTLFLNLSSLFVLISLLSTIIAFFPFFLITRNPENIKIGKIFESQNLYVKIKSNSSQLPSNNDNEDYNIFFIAHIDSKGQRITARTRGLNIFLFTISIFGITVILILRTFLALFYMLLNILAMILLSINLIATLILTSNTTNNKSKGAVDDASGIACVLELLNYFSAIKKNNNNYNLWFVLTGAEESGTMGIRNFYKIINNINRKKSIVNNFESLGKSVNAVISKNSLNNNLSYYNFFKKKGKEYRINTFINPISRGIHTDGIYLSRKNFNLFEYGSSEVGRFMHSEHDSLENVDVSLLKKLCEFIITTLEYFDNSGSKFNE
ncbi:MAG: M28 family peptidase [Promethearchaeota archaeon]